MIKKICYLTSSLVWMSFLSSITPAQAGLNCKSVCQEDVCGASQRIYELCQQSCGMTPDFSMCHVAAQKAFPSLQQSIHPQSPDTQIQPSLEFPSQNSPIQEEDMGLNSLFNQNESGTDINTSGTTGNLDGSSESTLPFTPPQLLLPPASDLSVQNLEDQSSEIGEVCKPSNVNTADLQKAIQILQNIKICDKKGETASFTTNPSLEQLPQPLTDQNTAPLPAPEGLHSSGRMPLNSSKDQVEPSMQPSQDALNDKMLEEAPGTLKSIPSREGHRFEAHQGSFSKRVPPRNKIMPNSLSQQGGNSANVLPAPMMSPSRFPLPLTQPQGRKNLRPAPSGPRNIQNGEQARPFVGRPRSHAFSSPQKEEKQPLFKNSEDNSGVGKFGNTFANKILERFGKPS